jgi:TonB family protein
MRANPKFPGRLARRCVRLVCAFVLGLTGVSAFAQQNARKVLAQPTPAYPPLMKQYRLSGTVKIQVVIGPDGQIKETRVVGGHPAFVEAALEALKKWKYAPSNTETTADLEFNFHP